MEVGRRSQLGRSRAGLGWVGSATGTGDGGKGPRGMAEAWSRTKDRQSP